MVGGGASGMMAAGRAAELGASVLLLEKTPRLGNKLRITGKGRCNLTNRAELADFVEHFGDNGRFLYSAFSRFFVDDLVDFFADLGVETKMERGGRIFPVSDDAAQVTQALKSYVVRGGTELRYRSPVNLIVAPDGRVEAVTSGGKTMPAAAVVLATGGYSYPLTGSTGDGHGLAAALGHTVIPVRPALVPLVVAESYPRRLEGLSLRNVQVKVVANGDPVTEQFGEMVFTSDGVSGPIILSLSKGIVDLLNAGHDVRLLIDLKPALSDEVLDARLRRDLDEGGKKQYRSILKGLLPSKIIDLFIELTRIPAGKPAHQISGEERQRLRQRLRGLELTVVRSRPIKEAIITAGGVSTEEIDQRTMESKLVRGLYFCGELIDIDADTGGYNLQAAFSTGRLAGESAALSLGTTDRE